MSPKNGTGSVTDSPLPPHNEDSTLKIEYPKVQRTVASSRHKPDNNTTSSNTDDFFDGSYFAVGESKSSKRKHSFFDYSLPAWSYLYNSTLLVLDILMALIACAITCLIDTNNPIYVAHQAHDGNTIVKFILLITCAWVISLLICEAYSRHTMGEGYELYSKIIKASLIFFIMICTLAYILKLEIPRSINILIPLITGMFTLFERWVMRRTLHRNRRNGEFVYDTILIGSPEAIHVTCQQLREDSGIGYKPIAVCPVMLNESNNPSTSKNNVQCLAPAPFTPNSKEEKGLKVLPVNCHLAQTAKNLKVSAVLITDVLSRSSETTRTLSLAVESMGIELAIATSVADLGGSSLHFRNDPNMPVLTAKLPQYTTRTRIFKRAMDIVLSLFAIIVLIIPMIIIAFKIHHEDGGPAFFSQERIGILGRPFTMYKFRSMRTDAEELKSQLAKENGLEDKFIFKLKDDPRITKFGHFIRKTSLDELPQFFNVLKGDMSLVGPRPPLPEEVAKYNTIYSSRLLVKPGITGPWQVSGRSEMSQEQSEFVDVSYIQNWSFTGDIAILLKTVLTVFRGTGV
jgi:exopolysaccharide biosynthesis polyprenyl glycosylphosphotransferase